MSIKHIGLPITFSLIILAVTFGQEPQSGGQLKYAEMTTNYTIDPVYGYNHAPSRRLIDLVYNSLLIWNEDLALMPSLAKELPEPNLEDNGSVRYRINLVDNVFWHDGEPLTADDVVFTIEALKDNITSSQAPVSDMVSSIISVKKVDTRCVDIYFANYSPQNRPSLTFKILPKHIFKLNYSIYDAQEMTSISTNNYLAENGCGTGPYKIDTFSGGFTLLAHNEDDYVSTSYIEMIQMKKEPNPNNLIGQAIKGTYQLVPSVPFSELGRLMNAPGWEIISYFTTSFSYMGMNCAKEPFNNVKFRQAIARAVNKMQIRRSVFMNTGQLLHGPYTPAHRDLYSPLNPHNYNPIAAKILLNALGYIDSDGDGFLEKDGKMLKVELLHETDNAILTNMALIIQQNLADIGISVELVSQQEATIKKLILYDHNFDMVMWEWKQLPYDGDLYAILHSSQRIPGLFNYVGYSNPMVDQLLEDARNLNDQDIRKQYYVHVAEIVSTEVPYVFIWCGPEHIGKFEKVHIPEGDINLVNIFTKIREWWLE